jgi:hypothetical protein
LSKREQKSQIAVNALLLEHLCSANAFPQRQQTCSAQCSADRALTFPSRSDFDEDSLFVDSLLFVEANDPQRTLNRPYRDVSAPSQRSTRTVGVKRKTSIKLG